MNVQYVIVIVQDVFKQCYNKNNNNNNSDNTAILYLATQKNRL